MVSFGGEYFMEISIGTPKIKVLGNADKWSDLTYIQCKPCKKYFKQKPQLFDLKNSSTHKLLPCESLYCISLMKDKRGNVKRNVCGYKYLYGDGSFSEGNICSEKFAIALSTGCPISFTKIIFGCGHSNVSVFDEAISVGKKRLAYTSSSWNISHKGNMIIDTRTTYTFIDPDFYEIFAEALEEAIRSKHLNLYVGYDLEKKKVFFKRADCAKHCKNA
ncbi:hypothetical protein Ddye_000544 [Dipteronia dyeriana]|uniref:Peptidase A1 domain-containing protein n=1 Tax=Dipteronia dyeriana TaxID=168575 RepID=A0AAD9XMK6_9ROSI|nr:hypothetical protein Ddye_000544 [Dipteronia dyeriana]